jgi:amino acid adenylation domain-containing protein
MNVPGTTNLTDVRQELLARWRQGHESQARPIAPRRVQDPIPLSYAQERLWFLTQLDPERASYNVSIGVRIRGPLDLRRLEQCISEVVRRHEILHTVFPVRDGQPCPTALPHRPSTLFLTDLRALPPAGRESQCCRVLLEDAWRPFDLACGPLWRVTVVQTDETDPVVALTLHHSVGDGWSIGLFLREVMVLYVAFGRGLPPPLPELPIQYADYAAWQRERLQGEVLERELRYWRHRLADAPALALPTDRPRPAIQSYRGAACPVFVPNDTVENLRRLAREEGATLFMALMAAFMTLLVRYTGEEDVSVGTPVAGRTRLEVESLIGCFVNTLVLRVDLGGNPSFIDVLRRVRKTALEAYAHQELPFEKLVAALHPARHLGRTPLFQVMLGLQNARTVALGRLPGELASELVNVERTTAKFDLEVYLEEWPTGVYGYVEYATDLFDRSTVERLVQHFVTLTEALASAPEQPIATVVFLRAPERQALLDAWPIGEATGAADADVSMLIEAQVARTPDAVAVVADRRAISYKELDAATERVARRLWAIGVGPGSAVGLLFERSIEAVIAIGAVFKAGGVCVPLDRSYPVQRLAFIVRDAGIAVVLTHKPALSDVPSTEAKVVLVDATAGETDLTTAARRRASLDDLAYVVYTSGSTGTPKGVAMPQRALVNLVEWQHALAPRGMRTLHFASSGFDVSFQEVISTLRSGGTLVIAPDSARRDPGSLSALIAVQQVECAFLPTLVLHTLAEQTGVRAGSLTSLRHVFVAGEQLRFEPAVVALFTRLQRCTLHNHYGPSETHVATSYMLPRDAPGDWPALPPIGRPISNARSYVLDSSMQPVPIGVYGELYLGGECVGRGYLRRPRLTAERFVPDPFGERAGRRLYRTGDLCRWTTSGVLEFSRRVDTQVKIRGYRVEPGEIEVALRACDAVADAAVTVPEHVAGDRRLVAHIVPRPGARLRHVDLRRELRQTLPEYMVPSVFVDHDALPLMGNGKLNRSALSAAVNERHPGAVVFAAPQTSTEKTLAETWAPMLGVERVGLDDDFFELGGHSLLAMRLVSRLRQTFGVDVPLTKLFEASSLRSVAAAIDGMRAAGAPGPADEAIVPVDRSRPLPLSFAQERIWFVDQLVPQEAAYNIPIAVRVRGELDIEAFSRSLAAVAHRHEPLRTRIESERGEVRQIVEPPRTHVAPVLDLAGLDPPGRDEALRTVLSVTTRRQFDLKREPAWRLVVIHLGDGEHVMAGALHHLVADGWSIGVLLYEALTGYEAARAGRPPQLTNLPVQYVDYAVWQRERFRGALLEREVRHWRERLEGVQTLAPATDHPRPPVPSFRGASCPIAVDAAVVEALGAIGRREGATLFMALMAAFTVLLVRYTDQDDICVGTVVAGRTRVEIEPLIGCFVNALALRVDASGDPTFVELLRHVRDAALDAYAHQELPFEKLVAELRPERDLARHPLFQVMFVLQNAARTSAAAVPVTSLQTELVPIEGVYAKFDLQLVLEAGPSGLAGYVEYATDLFERQSIELLIERYQTLLAGIAQNPQQRIWDLPLLSARERQQIRTSPALEAVPPGRSLHGILDARTDVAPDAVALVWGDRQVSYGGLRARTRRVARHLRALGVGPEVRVGLCARRSIDMVVGMLGILMAGGAYVPLDPECPAERLALMIEDVGARLVVIERSLLERIPQTEARLSCLDELGDDGFADSHDASPCLTDPDHAAYVMYTSGSTGRPKGVVVTHANVVGLLEAAAPAFRFDREDVWTLFHSFAFDVSVWEIWGALAYGGRLVIVPYRLSREPEQFHRLLAVQRVTVLSQTPSAFRQLIQVERAPSELALRLVIFGGEALDFRILRPWFARHGNERPRLINMYGITETTVHVTCCPVAQADVDATCGSVIGHPLPHLRLYILDRHGILAPVGVPGEIYVGGAGLARGYLGNPGLTAVRFVPDPFSGVSGARLYRTGDAGRYLADGRIEYIRRLDRQVKLRAHRIELGEIEAALRQHSSVTDAVVTLREDRLGDQRLAAYVVLRTGAVLESSEAQAHLRATLPAYMVPSAFVSLHSLPLTPNGKLDRRALPAPRTDRPPLGQAAPQPGLEEQLARIWKKVLDVESVGRHENFFDAGGHSLLLPRIVGEAQDLVDAKGLTILDLFDHPTIGSLAAHLAARRALKPVEQAVLIAVDKLQVGQRRLQQQHAVRRPAALTAPTCSVSKLT